MIGSLNAFQIDRFLQSEVIGRIGCSVRGKAYVVPITYVYNGKYIYAHTREGMKVAMMRKNPKVCFEVDQIRTLSNWQSVILWGTYQELRGKQAEEALQMIVNRLHPLSTSETSVPRHTLERPQSAKNSTHELVVFRIEIEEVTGKFEKQ